MPGRLAPAAACAALCACAQAAVVAPAPPPAAPAPPPRVLLTKPPADTVVRLPVALAEVAGVALVADATRHELVLALDFSSSAFEPTGRDVDGDGVIGVRKPWQPAVGSSGLRGSPLDWTTDAGDSIAGAELAATRTLLPRLDPATTRVALLAFGSSVRRVLPLSPPEAALAALEHADLGALIGGTNVSAALERAERLLGEGVDPGTQRSVVLITDGFPNLPPPQWRAEERVAEEAERLRRSGVRVHVLAIASQQMTPRPVLETLGRTTGGSFQTVHDPTELPVLLANTGLSAIEAVAVRNATTGAPALAVRVLPDGRFDAFVPLAPGENWIEVEARSAAGPSAPLRRRLLYEAPTSRDAGRSPEAKRLLETLRERTVELEALAELRERRQQQQHRELRIDPQSP